MTDTDDTKDLGVAIVLLKNLAEETLPKALEIKERLDRGELLDHWDIEFLEKLFKRAEEAKPLVDRHPEYQDVYAQTVHLYKQITDQAVLNEKGAATPGS
ncbi:MAG: hypothetical protein ACKN9T_16040 [Candidatus Methylumidiphilus sp.]